MILWTIQSREAWQVLQTQGIFLCYDQYVDKDDLNAYEWMVEKMNKLIPVQRPDNGFPLWAWYQWEGEKRKKPDLRSAAHLPRGQRGVRIEFQIDDHLVLLSDFELWHYVLNYWYLPTSTTDGENFDKKLAQQGLSFYKTKPLPDPAFHEIITKSWERIFDIEWEEKDIAAPRAKKSIQATFWELPLANVRRVDEFVAR